MYNSASSLAEAYRHSVITIIQFISRIAIWRRILLASFMVTLLLAFAVSGQDTIAPVTNNNDWQPRTESIDDTLMALVPPGCFTMGSAEGDQNERPEHEICIENAFWIDVTEVTNAAYGSVGTFENDLQPRESISWFDARDYCASRRGRLPTEAEWEYAARGPDSLQFTWGDTFNRDLYIWQANSSVRTTEVGSIPDGASWVGAMDMIGNVWEWTSTIFDEYPYDATDGREDSEAIGERTVRGGAFNFSQIARASIRDGRFEPFDERNNIGFRCAIDFDGASTSMQDTVSSVETAENTVDSTNTLQPNATQQATPTEAEQTVDVSPTARPTEEPINTLTIENNSNDDVVCYVFFTRNARPRTDISFDQLDEREVIRAGENRTWEVDAGTYRIVLQDCDRRDLGSIATVMVDGEGVLTYR